MKTKKELRGELEFLKEALKAFELNYAEMEYVNGIFLKAREDQEKEMLERVEKLVDSVASHFNAIRVRKENGESEWAFPDRSSELRTRENYQVSLVLKAFDEGLSSLKGKRRAIK